MMMMALVAVVGAAYADKPELKTTYAGKEVKPIRWAKVDANGKQISPWMYASNNESIAVAPPAAWDTFENDGSAWDGPPGDRYGADPNSFRWYFGAGYHNPYIASDMRQLNPGTEGGTAPYAQTSWYWETTEQCFMLISTYETFGYASVPALDGFIGGWIFDFGILDATTGGFYYANFDGVTGGYDWTMPSTNDGGFEMAYGNAFDGTNFTLASLAQPMLWGTEGTNPSVNDALQYDDDNPTDGVHVDAERYDYTYGVAPDPLGISHGFYTSDSGPITEVLAPTSYTLGPQGSEEGANDVSKVTTSDDVRAVAFNTTVANNNIPSIRYTFFFTSPVTTDITELKSTVESQSQFGNHEIRLEFVNATNNNAFVGNFTETETSPNVDKVRNLSLTNAGDISAVVALDGTVKTTCRGRKVGVMPAQKHRLRVDMAQLSVTHN